LNRALLFAAEKQAGKRPSFCFSGQIVSSQIEVGRKSWELIQSRFERLDHDQLGQLLADGEAGIANLADEIGLAGEKPDDLVFAKAEFAQTVLQFRGCTKLLDAHGHARFDTGEGANFAPGVFRWFN
jgi:hypothetical protein